MLYKVIKIRGHEPEIREDVAWFKKWGHANDYVQQFANDAMNPSFSHRILEVETVT